MKSNINRCNYYGGKPENKTELCFISRSIPNILSNITKPNSNGNCAAVTFLNEKNEKIVILTKFNHFCHFLVL